MLIEPEHANVDQIVKAELNAHLEAIERHLESDVVTFSGPILFGVDGRLRRAIESVACADQKRVTVLVDTPGGVVEVVERMVDTIRHHYDEVSFIIPDRAMSAGTVFAMSGDAIMMDYFSRLGPIDPQIEKDGRLVPALSYLVQFNRLLDKARAGELTNAEFALLSQIDLAEMHQYEQARNLTITLLRKWLATYKFKNWTETETHSRPVTITDREQRAEEIARKLSDNELWHSHGRGISMQTLREDPNLKIVDFAEDRELSRLVRTYHNLLRDYLLREQFPSFIHTRKFF